MSKEECDDKMSKIQLRAGICIPETTRTSIRRGNEEDRADEHIEESEGVHIPPPEAN